MPTARDDFAFFLSKKINYTVILYVEIILALILIPVMIILWKSNHTLKQEQTIDLPANAEQTATTNQTLTQVPQPLTPQPILTTQSTTISSTFKEQLLKVLSEAEKIAGMTTEGVDYKSYDTQLANLRGAYNLILDIWPNNQQNESKDELALAMEGWQLADKMWNYDITYSGTSVENVRNDYDSFVKYAGSELIIETYDKSDNMPELCGKHYLPFANIAILLRIAHNHFTKSKPGLLKFIQ